MEADPPVFFLEPLDYSAILIVVAAMIGVTLIRPRKKEEPSLLEFLIMGRRLTLPLFTATLVATWYGGIIGVTQIAFENGIYNFITQGVFWYATYILFAIFFVKKIRGSHAITLPELIGKRFGPHSRQLAILFNIFNVLPIAYVLSLGIFLQTVFGWNLTASMTLGTSIVVLYSLLGGFRAIVLTDIVQFIVMFAAVAMVFVFSVNMYGGMDFLTSRLPPNYFSFTGGHSLATTVVWGLIALSTLVDPNFYHRCFAAKSDRTAVTGIFVSTVIWCIFDLCTTFGAMYAATQLKSVDIGSASGYIIYSLNILPAGLRGFFVAGIAATILSTMDSYLFICSTTLSYDLFRKSSDAENIRATRIALVFSGASAVFLASFFDGSVKAVWKTFGSYSAGCFLFPVVYGFIFPKKIADLQFVAGCTLGAIGITMWRLIDRSGMWSEIDDLYVGVIMTTAGILIWPMLNRKFRRSA